MKNTAKTAAAAFLAERADLAYRTVLIITLAAILSGFALAKIMGNPWEKPVQCAPELESILPD